MGARGAAAVTISRWQDERARQIRQRPALTCVSGLISSRAVSIWQFRKIGGLVVELGVGFRMRIENKCPGDEMSMEFHVEGLSRKTVDLVRVTGIFELERNYITALYN